MSIQFALFGFATVIGMVAFGVLVYLDLTRRGVDPVTTILWFFFFWPVGLYLWMKKRSENPHPTLR